MMLHTSAWLDKPGHLPPHTLSCWPFFLKILVSVAFIWKFLFTYSIEMKKGDYPSLGLLGLIPRFLTLILQSELSVNTSKFFFQIVEFSLWKNGFNVIQCYCSFLLSSSSSSFFLFFPLAPLYWVLQF